VLSLLMRGVNEGGEGEGEGEGGSDDDSRVILGTVLFLFCSTTGGATGVRSDRVG